MSASKRAKELGAPSLNWVAVTLGRDVTTLHYRYRVEPEYFDILVAGCVTLHIGNGLVEFKAQLDDLYRSF